MILWMSTILCKLNPIPFPKNLLEYRKFYFANLPNHKHGSGTLIYPILHQLDDRGTLLFQGFCSQHCVHGTSIARIQLAIQLAQDLLSSFASRFCCLVGWSGNWAASVWSRVHVALPNSSLEKGFAGCPWNFVKGTGCETEASFWEGSIAESASDGTILGLEEMEKSGCFGGFWCMSATVSCLWPTTKRGRWIWMHWTKVSYVFCRTWNGFCCAISSLLNRDRIKYN